MPKDPKDPKIKPVAKATPKADSKVQKGVIHWLGTPSRPSLDSTGHISEGLADFKAQRNKSTSPGETKSRNKTKPSPEGTDRGFKRSASWDSPSAHSLSLQELPNFQSSMASNRGNLVEIPPQDGIKAGMAPVTEPVIETEVSEFVVGHNLQQRAAPTYATAAEENHGSLDSFQGDWKLNGEKIGTIMGAVLSWCDGSLDTVLSRQGDDILMELDGVQYIGNAGLVEGEIHWNDGDVWQKEALEFPGGRLPVSDEQSLGNFTRTPSEERERLLAAPSLEPEESCEPKAVSMVDLEGLWYLIDSGDFLGKIEAGILVWEDGRETRLFLDRNSLIMDLDGECYQGQPSVEKGQILWSDGDTWERRLERFKLQASRPEAEVREELATEFSSHVLSSVPPPNVQETAHFGYSRIDAKKNAENATTDIVVATDVDVNVATLAGEWYQMDSDTFIATISGDSLFLIEDGRDTSLFIQGCSLTMHLDGEKYFGQVSRDGFQISWSDGDSWYRPHFSGGISQDPDYAALTAKDAQKEVKAEEVQQGHWAPATEADARSKEELLQELQQCRELLQELQRREIEEWIPAKMDLERSNLLLRNQVASMF